MNRKNTEKYYIFNRQHKATVYVKYINHLIIYGHSQNCLDKPSNLFIFYLDVFLLISVIRICYASAFYHVCYHGGVVFA